MVTCTVDVIWPAVTSLSLALSAVLTVTLVLTHARPRVAASPVEPGEPPLDQHVQPARRPDWGP